MARYQSVTIRDVIMQDDMAFKKKEFDLMKADRADYEKTSESLAALVQNEPLRVTPWPRRQRAGRYQRHDRKIVDLTMSDDMAGASAMIRDQLRPAQVAHVKALDEVIDSIKVSSAGATKRPPPATASRCG